MADLAGLWCFAFCGGLSLGLVSANDQTTLSFQPQLQSDSWAEFDSGSTTALALVENTELRFEEPAPAAAPAPAPSAAPADNAGELAKKLSNPISSLISVPLQFNFDTGYGPKDADRLLLNVQPVIPFAITDDWNLIVRTIVPVVYLESLADGIDSEFGLGDILQSFFFSPKKEVGGWILGAGPAFNYPTATDDLLGTGQLGIGPTVVALRQEHGWTYGMLMNHIWGVTESDDHPDLNSTFLQPFLAYNFPTATSLTLNTETTYDWTSEEWTVPLNLIVGQIVKFGRQPVQFSLGGRYYIEAPDDGPEWGVRFVVTFLFPR